MKYAANLSAAAFLSVISGCPTSVPKNLTTKDLHLLSCAVEKVVKCAASLSAAAFPSVISACPTSVPKKAVAADPPPSVTATIWIGRFGMFIENALGLENMDG